MYSTLRDTWRKNVPELFAACTRGLPSFIFSDSPAPRLGGIPVFCYHDVEPAGFESHLRFLRDNGYVTLSAGELLDYLRGARAAGNGHRGREIVLTFDDGLSSLFQTAYPLLRRFGQRGVAFIAPAFHDSPAATRLPVCTWDQLREMNDSGIVDIQAHTFEHRLVRRWPAGSPLTGVSVEQCDQFRGPALSMAADFARAKTDIESRLGKSVRHMAFPQYDGSPEAIAAGRAAGYEAFYWGVRPGIPINGPDAEPDVIVRLSGEFLPRLPGIGRTSLHSILRRRYALHASRWLARLRRKESAATL